MQGTAFEYGLIIALAISWVYILFRHYFPPSQAVMNVTHHEDSSVTFILDLNQEPDALETRRYITFRVNRLTEK